MSVPIAWRIVRALRARGATRMIPPVAVYVAVIAVMVASAIAGGNGPIAIIVTYHCALAGLVVGLA